MNIKVFICAFVFFITFSITVYAQEVKEEDISRVKNYATNYNDRDAQSLLGRWYEEGKYVEKSLNSAYYWFSRAAEKGDVYAICRLAVYYIDGNEVVKKDVEKSLSLFKKAARLNSSYANTMLGAFYFRSDNEYIDGYRIDGINGDDEKSFQYFKEGALQGHYLSKFHLAYCYARGKGVESDSIKALIWIDRTIKGKYYRAYYLKGLMYENGWSVSRDLSYAYQMYEEGYRYNEKLSTYKLSLCYKDGIGINKDLYKALSIIQKAIDLDFNDPNFIDTKGEILWMLGRTEQAKQVWNEVKKISPKYYDKHNTALNKYILGD